MAEPEHTLEKVVEDLRQRWDKLTPQQRAVFHQSVRAFDYPPGTDPPVSEWVSAIPDHPDFEAFKKEYAAFENMLPELLASCPGQFVAVFHGKVVDKGNDRFELAGRVQSRYEGEFVLIHEVTAEPDQVLQIDTPGELP